MFCWEMLMMDPSKRKSKESEECGNRENLFEFCEFKKDFGKSDLFTLLDF